MVQEYNHHLSAVNTVTFYDNATRFASTSDDKKMLLWEWDIPVRSRGDVCVLCVCVCVCVRVCV